MADINEMRETLVSLIMAELSVEFQQYHLTFNLVNTIKVTRLEGKTYIEIPAPVYNMKKYIETGVIERRGHGSYANKLDERGSRWGHHKGYVDRCINNALSKWKNLYGITAEYKDEKVQR